MVLRTKWSAPFNFVEGRELHSSEEVNKLMNEDGVLDKFQQEEGNDEVLENSYSVYLFLI